MRVKMLVATGDIIYTRLISEYISENHADTIEIGVCNTTDCMHEMLSTHKYDVALMDAAFITNADTELIQLPLLLWSEHEADELSEEFERIHKHQRISSIVAEVLEQFAKVSGNRRGSRSGAAKITAVWSPTGGAGKTSVAIAYSAICADSGKEVLYLNLESFSGLPVYFSERGKSISTVFEMLDNNEGNVKMLVRGICCRERGITYLCPPDNYDDICVITAENIYELVTSCAETTDELVVDLSCACDERTRQVFELAGRVLLVTEQSQSARTKLSQFLTQNDVFERIREKTTLIANKGARINEPAIGSLISLPFVETADAHTVINALKDCNFA